MHEVYIGSVDSIQVTFFYKAILLLFPYFATSIDVHKKTFFLKG